MSYATGNSAMGNVYVSQWATGKSHQYHEALNSAARLSTGTSGEEEAKHAPPGMSSLIRTANKLKDIANVVDAVGDGYRLTFDIASAVPAGEAGATIEVVEATFKIAGEGGTVALNTQGKEIVSEMTSNYGVRNSFANQEYTIVEAQNDIHAVRIFGNKSGEEGSYLGFIPPKSSAEAESLYYLKAYGNDASFMTPVTIKKGTQMAIGRVNGGQGAQIYIPLKVQGNGVKYFSKQTTTLR